MLEYDPGPPPQFLELFERAPSHAAFDDLFWYDWGPVFYRGRLDGSARVLCIASDPGPTERLVGRTLVGDAGQRVQGLLTKIGLSRSYLCLNAHLYAVHPGKAKRANAALNDPAILNWRNELYDAARTPELQAIIAFGDQAQKAVDLWEGKGDLPVFKISHPSSRYAKKLLDEWRAAVVALRQFVAADENALASSNYGALFGDADYAPIPRRDLPFGVPAWIGDDAWGRAIDPKRYNCVYRPAPDDEHTLIWVAPRG